MKLKLLRASEAVVGSGLLPSTGDLIFLILIWLILYGKNFLLGDGSTGWNLVYGNYILHSRAVPHCDLTSYTFRGAPWTYDEWLSGVIMAAVTNLGGLAGLSVFFAGLIALLFLLLYKECRRTGCGTLPAAVLVLCGAFASSIHWSARPHIFSWFGVYIFAVYLERFRTGQISWRKLLVILGATSVLWTNLHPSWFLGPGMVALYLGCMWVELVLGERKDTERKVAQLKRLLLILLTCTFASLLNPYGTGLYAYIWHYFKDCRTIIVVTQEYMPLPLHGEFQSSCFEILVAAGIIGLAYSSSVSSLPQFILFLTLGYLAFSSSRFIPLFAIVNLPFICKQLATVHFIPDDSLLRPLADWWKQRGANFNRGEQLNQRHLLPIAVAVVLCMDALGIRQAKFVERGRVAADFNPELFPVQTVSYIFNHKLPLNQGFNLDNWGGYLTYKFNMPVFIDDRVAIYGAKFYDRYDDVRFVRPGWEKILNEDRINWILMPKQDPIAERLKEEPETVKWKLVCEDKAAALFIRIPGNTII